MLFFGNIKLCFLLLGCGSCVGVHNAKGRWSCLVQRDAVDQLLCKLQILPSLLVSDTVVSLSWERHHHQLYPFSVGGNISFNFFCLSWEGEYTLSVLLRNIMNSRKRRTQFYIHMDANAISIYLKVHASSSSFKKQVCAKTMLSNTVNKTPHLIGYSAKFPFCSLVKKLPHLPLFKRWLVFICRFLRPLLGLFSFA